MDGVLADFGEAFHAIEARLFGAAPSPTAGEPAREEENREASARRVEDADFREAAVDSDSGPDDDNEKAPGLFDELRTAQTSLGQSRRRRDRVWRTIQATPNFWSSLKPLDPGAVRRIHEMTLRHQWEVFFITQRPHTAGDTVQRQTQHWLVQQGFDLPSVLVLPGSRGAAAAALRLDFLVDDSARNCLDVISDSTARPLLIVPDEDGPILTGARRLGIGTASTIGECLDLLEKATAARRQPSLLHRLSSLVGWR